MTDLNQPIVPELTSQAVCDFLRDHPQFFLNHPSALLELDLRHDCAPAHSLIELQVRQLRKQYQQLQNIQRQQHIAALENEHLTTALLQLAKRLIDCTTKTEVVYYSSEILRADFRIDYCDFFLTKPSFWQKKAFAWEFDNQLQEDVCLLDDETGISYRFLAPELFADYINTPRPRCLRLADAQKAFIFKPQPHLSAPKVIESQAFIPVFINNDLCAVMVLSSHHDALSLGLGHFYLENISDLLSQALYHHSL